MTNKQQEKITTKIWREVPEDDNPFAAAACYCAGFDVFGDVLRNASYIDYLYLLFKHEPPTAGASKLLEGLALALANPGLRDHSVRAAMCAAVGGSTRASALIASISVGAGNLGGGREVYTAVNCWQACGTDLAAWEAIIKSPPQEERVDVWMPMEHAPGFDPNGVSCPKPVRQTLAYLAEAFAKAPLAMSGVAAAAMNDLSLSAEESEILFMLLRLPGAAAHSIEQEKLGWRRYPFFGNGLKLMPYDQVSDED